MERKRNKKRFFFLALIFTLTLSFSVLANRTNANAAVKLSRTRLSFCIGETQTLKVTGTSDKVKWSSSDKSIAKVSSKGKVKGIKQGKATITAKVAGKQLKCKVTIFETIGTYYSLWNVRWDPSPAGKTLTEAQAAEVRRAINLLLDRTYIAKKIVKGGAKPASTLVAMGIMEPDGSQFYSHAGPKNAGYYPAKAQKTEAMKILKKYYSVADGKVTDFPEIEYIYNNEGSHHQAIAEYIQSQLNAVGIQVQITGYDWEKFKKILVSGNYTFARSGWAADINDPVTFLEQFSSAAGENLCGFGKGTHKSRSVYSVKLKGIGKYKNLKGTWKQTYQKLISYIKKEKNKEVRTQLMHKAEDLVMSTGCICPIIYYS